MSVKQNISNIKSKLTKGSDSSKILENISWLMFDKVLRMGTALFITTWLARYLGPEKFGIWNYALAYIAITGSISTLSLDSIIIKDLVDQPDKKHLILGSAYLLRVMSATIAFLIGVVIIFIIPLPHDALKVIVVVMSISFIFQAFDVIDFYFQSQIQSKFVVFARSMAFLITTIIKIILIINKASLVSFAIVYTLDILLSAILLITFYQTKKLNILNWRVNKQMVKQTVKDGLPLFLAFISAILYLKIDQIMIGQMMDEHSIGLYSASLKIYEIFFSVIIIVTNTIFPKIISLYKDNKELFLKRYSQITSLYTLLGIMILIVLFFASNFVINLLFGSQYLGSSSVLLIHILTLIVVYNGNLRGSYLLISSNQNIIFITTFTSLIINIILNYFLIKKYGIIGAAVATTITQLLSLFISNLFFKATRILFFIQLKSFILMPLWSSKNNS